MDISKRYQHRSLNGMRIACSGVEGAFAHIAAKRIFPDGQYVFFPDFEDAYRSVEKGECDSCALPIENSYAGEVTKVTDLVFSGSLYMNGVFDLEIHHSLLGLPNAEIGDIRKVIGHPQAASLIGRHGFNMRARRGNTSSTWKQRGIFTGRTVRQCLRSSPGNVFG